MFEHIAPGDQVEMPARKMPWLGASDTRDPERPARVAVVEEEHDSEGRAYENARRFWANGYDVTVHVVAKELVAKWKKEESE